MADENKQAIGSIISYALIGLVLTMMGILASGAWYMSSQAAQFGNLTERVSNNNQNVTTRLSEIIGQLTERISTTNAQLTEREVRFEHDVSQRFDADERRLDDNTKNILSLNDRLTRVEAQREFGASTGVKPR